MTEAVATRPGALSTERINQQTARFPDYRAPDAAPARKFATEAKNLWGGLLLPMMAHAESRGRFAHAALSCPPTASTGTLALDQGAQSQPWRNPEAIENIVCLEGSVEVRVGPDLNDTITLGQFDMLSVPVNVRHQLVVAENASARVVLTLSVEPQGSYDAVFSADAGTSVSVAAQKSLGLRFDGDKGADVDLSVLQGRTTRFDSLVPYKKDLNRTGGLPPEATESLSAGNVYPLIVPEGHIGRSRTAPMYGNQGLYISIAECKAGDDGPPPHAHSDTQESFFVLDGTFDICTGFDNESFVKVTANDLVAMPNKVMRTFRNTTGRPARLLVIIQGPDRMQDTVSFSRKIGEDFERRFGKETIEGYAKIRMTFDAEERAGA